jgi:hypothetical protein
MRFATTLFAALVLAGALPNEAQAQPGITTPGPGRTAWRDLDYKGPYSVYGPGLTYRQLDYVGPYSGRLSSPSRPAPTRTTSDPSSRTAGVVPPSGNGWGMDIGGVAAPGGDRGLRRPRYVRISIAGGTIQALVIR